MPQFPSPTAAARAQLAVTPLRPKERLSIRAAAPLLLMPVESAVAQASCRGQEFTLDRSSFLFVPLGCQVVLRTSAAASRVATVSFGRSLAREVVEIYGDCGIDSANLERTFGRLELLPRTVWIHELVHRYVFERYTLGQSDNQATAFLETELLKEVHFLLRDHDAGSDRASIEHRRPSCIERAVAHIEANLFRSCSVAVLARRAGASESTLLRAFHRELGCSPAAYWRNRKLDEALILLRSGNRSVGEVAELVGYENATAFAFAFRARFGRSPSSFLPRGSVRPAP